MENRFSVYTPTVLWDFSSQIEQLLTEAQICQREIIFLCIGTDRSTGDSLGPLTGSKLEHLHLDINVFGTLENPVHATNIIEQVNSIKQNFSRPYIIAIDACLGRLDAVGFLSLGRGSVKPGAAVKKDLPAIGDAYITGIVNVSGFMEHLVLQSTRLHLVMKMADIISISIARATRKLRLKATI